MNTLKKARRKIDIIDRKTARLFCRRMKTVEDIFAYKRAHSLPIRDLMREAQMTDVAENRVTGALLSYYRRFLQITIALSRAKQEALSAKEKTDIISIPVISGTGSYQIYCGKGILSQSASLFSLDRKVLLVTDEGVPANYVKSIADFCQKPIIVTLPMGENSKSVAAWKQLSDTLLTNGFSREDCVVAVGGGMVGDLAGFTASTYMRGIDFYNVPTTLLSQVDSSVGGKTAVNFGGYKNIVGTFYPPKAVLIDSDVLTSLSPRFLSEGMAEVIKMACTCDEDLFDELETHLQNGMEELLKKEGGAVLRRIILRALVIKKDIVERDEYEAGPRRVLNFGHTIGHAVESTGKLLHGECVALGMLAFSAENVKNRLLALYRTIGLPCTADLEAQALAEAISHDKKAERNGIQIVFCPTVGSYEIREHTVEEIVNMATDICRKEPR